MRLLDEKKEDYLLLSSELLESWATSVSMQRVRMRRRCE